MATSKLTREDAQEWLSSLQQVGEGWWRQVGLAIRANAHKSLGMSKREFSQQIGQRLIDPREAIVELYEEGHSQTAIAQILGVSVEKTVQRVLAEEGRVEVTSALTRRTLERHTPPGGAALSPNTPPGGDLDERVAELESELEIAVNKAEREQEKQKDEIKELSKRGRELKKELETAQKGSVSEVDRERMESETEAQLAQIEAKFIPMFLATAAEKIVQAREAVKEAIELGLEVKHDRHVERVAKALDAFSEEWAVAQAMVGEKQ